MRLVIVLMVLGVCSIGCDDSETTGEGENSGAAAIVSGPGGLDNANEEENGTSTSEDPEGEGKPVGEGNESEGEESPEGNEGAAEEELECEPYDEGNTAVHGMLYADSAPLATSVYAAEIGDEDALETGITVGILPGDAVVATCDDGGFSFNGLEDGPYVVDLSELGDRPCTTRNCPQRFPAAIREGKVRLTTFGDSVPKVGSSTLFPKHLETLLNGVVETTSVNVAVPGSKTVDWLPGTYNFVNELAPTLANTDVLIASIGGNDVTQYASDVLASGNIGEALNGGVNTKLVEIMGNVLTIFEEVKAINPDIDVVYCLYPNYANSDQWGSFLGGIEGVAGLVATLIVDALEQIRDEMPVEKGLVLVDMYGALEGQDLTDILYDELHFNDVGHVIYAEEIFRALGGVIVENGSAPEVTVGLQVE